jgi:tripartite ATP-independent transporter DctM subunit
MNERSPAPLLRRLENGVSLAVLAAMVVLPLIEIGARTLGGTGVPGSIPLVEHLTLWIALLGAALAARSERLLALSTASLLGGRARRVTGVATGIIATAVTAALVMASLNLVMVEHRVGNRMALGIPLWAVLAILPVGFSLVGWRLIRSSSSRVAGQIAAAAGVAIPLLLGAFPELRGGGLVLPAGLALLAGTAVGLPIFAAIGGLALLLFWKDGIPLASVPEETYRLAASPLLPAIPLFTLAGYILSEGRSSQRLMRLLTAFVGFMPGGLAVSVTLLLALFTPLTGASGITILSLGGILLPVLVRARYPERFAVGLVTVAGSIGLLLPPSLPVILYGVTANLSILDLFVGALVPGLLLIGGVAAWGVRAGIVSAAERSRFVPREAAAAAWGARWEIALPVVVLGSYFGGLTTLMEAAAMSVVAALLVECVLFRELSWLRDLPRIAVESATLTGGFLIILGVALGLTNYMVLAEIPMRALDIVSAYVESPWVFLLALNLFLIVVGGLMDIYSAIFVVVPLILPMADAYGVHPVHLAVIFLANLELGYLTPPMGENLFLSAYRFDQPLTTLFRSTLPLWLILLLVVLLITYVPALTLWPLSVLRS